MRPAARRVRHLEHIDDPGAGLAGADVAGVERIDREVGRFLGQGGIDVNEADLLGRWEQGDRCGDLSVEGGDIVVSDGPPDWASVRRLSTIKKSEVASGVEANADETVIVSAVLAVIVRAACVCPGPLSGVTPGPL